MMASATSLRRTLLATAKSLGEQLCVNGFSGEMVSCFEDLPPSRACLPDQSIYAALVHFYDDEYRGDPVRAISRALAQRSENDLSPLPTGSAPRELLPLMEITNQHMQRLSQLLEHQTELANQMLALAKVEQLRDDKNAPIIDWAEAMRSVALDLAPQIAERELVFSLDLTSAPVCSHAWALRELGRNLLHNAIKLTPEGSRLTITLVRDARTAAPSISDSGPGVSEALRERLFQPFATDHGARPSGAGSGLGLSICCGIVMSLGGGLSLDNRVVRGRCEGLDVTVRLPMVLQLLTQIPYA